MAEASQEDLIELQRRHTAISPYLAGGTHANKTPADRSIRRWRDSYLELQRQTGVGLAGIFPGRYKSGNWGSPFNEQVERVIEHVLKKHFLGPEGETVTSTWLRIMAIGARLKIAQRDLPSYRTIVRRCGAVDSYKKVYRRFGKRAAHAYRPIHRGKSPLGSPHGQKSWMIAHCDSTQLDLAHTHENQTKEIEHLWHTKMVDAFDGRVLAWYTCRHRPSAETLQALMLDCAQKHGVLPATIVVDWGSEHRNTWMEKTLARIGVIVHYRPKATPVNGAPVESHFAKLSKELTHNLTGNTKLLQRARIVTKAVDPRNNTIWSEPLIHELLAAYYETVNDTPRRSRPSPNEIAAGCEAKFGPPPVQVLDPELLRRILLPYVDGVRRKVSCRGTIRCRYGTYSHGDLREFNGKFVDVRFDPKDPCLVFVDHPARREVLPCSVVDPDLKYADDAADAVRIVEQASLHRLTSGAQIQTHRVGFTEKLLRLEEKAKAQANPPKPRPKSRPKPGPIEMPQHVAQIIPLKLEQIISK